VISFLYDPDEILATNVKRCQVKTVLTMDPRPTDRHVTEHLCSILNRVAIFAEDLSPELSLKVPSAESPARADVALHCGSGSEKKNWAIENWRELLKFLVARGHHVTVIEGEADTERTAQLLKGISSPLLSVIRNKSLLEVAGAIQSARLFIGHDTGITHLAASLDVPTIALFGPSNPHLWAPRARHGRVLWKNAVWDPKTSSPLQLAEISVDDNSPELVKAEVAKALDSGKK